MCSIQNNNKISQLNTLDMPTAPVPRISGPSDDQFQKNLELELYQTEPWDDNSNKNMKATDGSQI